MALDRNTGKQPPQNGEGLRHTPAEKKYNLEELEKISSGDENFVTEMLEVFIKNTQLGIEELQAAAKEDNMDRVSQIAHKIVAPCRHLSIEGLVKNLKAIELKAVEENVDRQEIKELINLVSNEADELLPALREEIKQRSEQVTTKS